LHEKGMIFFFTHLQYKLVSQIINFIYNISNISNYNFNKKNFILVISELGNALGMRYLSL